MKSVTQTVLMQFCVLQADPVCSCDAWTVDTITVVTSIMCVLITVWLTSVHRDDCWTDKIF